MFESELSEEVGLTGAGGRLEGVATAPEHTLMHA